MIHFNARSLNANFENIKDDLYLLRHPFHVVANCFTLQGNENKREEEWLFMFQYPLILFIFATT